jgi:hypothetical protein
MAKSAALLVPTATVPVSPEVGGVVRHDNEMSNANLDDSITTRTRVALACLIRLNRVHRMLFELPQ